MDFAIEAIGKGETISQSLDAIKPVNASRDNVVDSIRQISDGGVDFAIEAIGKGETISQSLDAIKPGGTAVVVGAVPFGEKATIDSRAAGWRKNTHGFDNRYIKTSIRHT